MNHKKKDYKNECWWCGEKADSREHIYKKTDFELIFGKSNFSLESGPVLHNIDNGKAINIQSSTSKFLKYKFHNLCQNCNNSKSAKMDKAYERVIKYIFENDNEILSNREINFQKIFPENSMTQKREFEKYCLKYLGCNFATNNIKVPDSLISFLKGDTNEKSYIIKFRIREDIHYLMSKDNLDLKIITTKALADLNLKKDKDKVDNGFISIYFIQWFRIIIIYSDYIKENKLNKTDNLNDEVELTHYISEHNLEKLNTYEEKINFVIASINQEKNSVN